MTEKGGDTGSVVGGAVGLLDPGFIGDEDAVVCPHCAVVDFERCLGNGVGGDVDAAVVCIPGHEVEIALGMLGPVVVTLRGPSCTIP